MRAPWVMFVALVGCGPVAVGAAVASSVISRAQGGCVAQCIAGTECDRETGFCRPRPPPDRIASSTPAPTLAAETPVVESARFPEGGEGFACHTRTGWSDDVVAGSPSEAVMACEELSGEHCECERAR